MITVLIPTVPGREELLARAIASYEATTADVEIIVLPGYPTCGAAWTDGAGRAQGDYIAFSADDIEALPGWAAAATDLCDEGKLPAAVLYNTDGSLQACGGGWGRMEPDGAETSYSRTPVIKREWWDFIGPVPPEMHYYTDDYVTWRCRQHDIPPVVSHRFRLIHHLSPIGRLNDRMGTDGDRFQKYVRGEA